MRIYLRSLKFKIVVFVLLGGSIYYLLPSDADKMRSKVFLLKNEDKKIEVFDGFKEPNIPNNSENDSTLLGIDSNKNGVRDDVEIWINRTWGTYNERMALRQYAQDLQYSLTAAEKNTKDFAEHSASMEFTSGKCLRFIWDFDRSREIIGDLRTLTYNTKERKRILRNFSSYSYSIKSTVPGMFLGQEYKGCRFEVENKKNLMERYINKHNLK